MSERAREREERFCVFSWVGVCVCVCAWVCMCCLCAVVALSACERRRERQRERGSCTSTQREEETERLADCYTRPPHLPQGDLTPPHTTQHTSLFGARRLRQRLCLLPRCLLLLRLLSRCCLLIRQLLCGRSLCFCFCRDLCLGSRLSNAPTVSYKVSSPTVSSRESETGIFCQESQFQFLTGTLEKPSRWFQLRSFPFPRTTLHSY